MEKYELKENNTYYYKNHLYKVLHIGKSKVDSEESSKWNDCVIYKRSDNPNDIEQQKMFVRSIEDFLKNFELIEYEGIVFSNGILTSNIALSNGR